MNVSTCCLKMIAEVLVILAAESAGAAGRVDPGNTDPVAGFVYFRIFSSLHYSANYLVSRYHRESRRRGPSFNFVEFGVADAA